VKVRLIFLELIAAELFVALMSALLAGILIAGVVTRHEPRQKAHARRPVPVTRAPRVWSPT
jgi:uncharacterized protein (DUF58 family)